MSSLDVFTREVKAFSADVVPKAVVTFHIAISFEGLRRIVLKTPVDFGRARANTQVSVARALPPGLVDSDDKDGSATIARGLAQLKTLKPFSFCVIGNNVPYFDVLENGGYVPSNPENSPEANKARAQRRTKAKQGAVATALGDPGAPLVRDGRAIQAPKGMVMITFEELVGMFP